MTPGPLSREPSLIYGLNTADCVEVMTNLQHMVKSFLDCGSPENTSENVPEFGRLGASPALLLSPMESVLLSPRAQAHGTLLKVTLHKYILSKFQSTSSTSTSHCSAPTHSCLFLL